MRNLLALLGLLVIGFAAVGWYCGWYKLSISRGQEGNLQIKTDVDTDKVVNDTSGFFQKMGQLMEQRGEKNPPAKTPATSTKDENFDGGWLLAPSKPASGGR